MCVGGSALSSFEVVGDITRLAAPPAEGSTVPFETSHYFFLGVVPDGDWGMLGKGGWDPVVGFVNSFGDTQMERRDNSKPCYWQEAASWVIDVIYFFVCCYKWCFCLKCS